MQSWLTLPQRLGTRAQCAKQRLSLPQRAILAWAGVDDYQAILDLDCADGRLLSYYLEHFRLRACGIAANDQDLLQAGELLGQQAELIRAKRTDIPWRSGSFDCAFLTQAPSGYKETCLMAKEVLRVLKPGGRLIIAANGIPFWSGLLLRQAQASQPATADKPMDLMHCLHASGFQDLSMRMTHLRCATVVGHAPEAVR